MVLTTIGMYYTFLYLYSGYLSYSGLASERKMTMKMHRVQLSIKHHYTKN